MEEINRTELESEIVPIKAFAETVVISSDDDNIKAADYLKKIKTAMKTVKDKFKPLLESAFQAHKKLKAFEGEFLTPLESAEMKIKTAMIKFEREAEAERQRLQAIQEAEARRIEAEAQKAAEQAAKLAEKGKDEKAEVKQAVAETLQIKADEIRSQVVEKPMTKVSGISYRETWKAIIKDPLLIPREYLVPNQPALDGVAKATKGTITIPGVEFKAEKIIASKGW